MSAEPSAGEGWLAADGAAIEAVLAASHVVAHAESRGLTHPGLDLANVSVPAAGGVQVTGWDLPHAEMREETPARALQSLLRRAIVPFGPAPPEVWRIVRYPYANAGEFARDLAAYLEGRGVLLATTLSLSTRVGSWARRNRFAAIAAAALVVAVVGASAFGLAGWLAQRAEEKDAHARAATLVSEVRERDRERLETLRERRELYHQIESLEPSDEEVGLADRIAELSYERERLARGAGATFEIERGRLEWLFELAAFEEEKTLSTRTVSAVRATRPVAEALAAGELEKARERVEGMELAYPDDPYRAAANALVEAASRFPDELASLSDLVEKLRARGRLSIRGPAGLAGKLQVVARDDQERWVLESPRIVPAGATLELDPGVYLYEVTTQAATFRVEVLIERSEEDTIDLGELPDSVPPLFVWIPAADFYRGGDGVGATRYRKDRVDAGFFILGSELSWGWAKVMAGSKFGAGPDNEPVLLVRPEDFEQLLTRAELSGRIRLPTEAEWELAARGVAGRVFPWGDRPIEGVANLWGPRRKIAPVGVGVSQEDRSIYGVLGMGGNVSEWTSTSSGAAERIVKGGDLFSPPGEAATPGRRSIPTVDALAIGFRPVLARER